ncbi:MAG: hypothetical protein AUJ51_06580 [Elusimicrobia bacterium CG1_02_56_21]|nr:MAG: hypothetical protein AUJ51_06580 [Elusimicrobia bacterium CG1_02_56_21]
MPRTARLDIPGCLYHVISRGNERRKIFYDKGDRADFVKRLRTALGFSGAKCLAWCLMSNHFHLLLLRGAMPLADLMSRLLTGYAVGFNLKHERCGHLFQNRYKSILCDEEEYFKGLVAYINLNPLRAGLAQSLAELEKYRWCGHGGMVGSREADFLERDYILSHFGADEESAVNAYTEFLEERKNKYKGGEYSGGGLVKSRGGAAGVLAAANGRKELSDWRILGSGDFVETILREAGELPGAAVPAKEIMREVCGLTGVSENEILGGGQARTVTRARALYCRLAKERCRARVVDLAETLGLSSGAVSRLIERGKALPVCAAAE